jgi:tetratricopeptide (TPR) repeat protein
LDGISFWKRENEDAIKHLRVAKALQPTPEVLYQLGLACLRSGQIDAARSAYREGVELFGANSGVVLRVPQYLQWCIQEDIYPEIAREILFQYWPDGR